MGNWTMWLLISGLMGITAVLYLWSRRLRGESGVPAGDIIYTDTGMWFPNDSALHAADLRLVGKPDYLVETPDGDIIPVEVKSGNAPAEPWDGHVLQLAAYCLLVEEEYGKRPFYGILQYKDRAFAIDYTPELEDNLLNTLADMRDDAQYHDIPRDHNDPQRCAHCSMNTACDSMVNGCVSSRLAGE